MTARAIIRRLRRTYALPRAGAATIYLLHFDRPFGHARHYLGYTGRELDARITDHREGRGSALVRAVLASGIDFHVALSFKLPLDRARSVERLLKNGGTMSRICPHCFADDWIRRIRGQRLRRMAERIRKQTGNNPEVSDVC